MSWLKEELDKDAGCHRFYSNCTARRALKGFGDFKGGGQMIRTVKYTDNLVLPTKAQTVLQVVIDILFKIGKQIDR